MRQFAHGFVSTSEEKTVRIWSPRLNLLAQINLTDEKSPHWRLPTDNGDTLRNKEAEAVGAELSDN